MSATYDPTLPSDKDHVRFLIQDTDVSGTNALLSDEEITAILTSESLETGTGVWLKFFAAAECLQSLLIRWGSKGKGLEEKQVSKLRLRYGGGAAVFSLKSMIQDFQSKGSRLLRASSGSTILRVTKYPSSFTYPRTNIED